MNQQAILDQATDTPTAADLSRARSTHKKKSPVSPAFTGAVVGAIAGRFLPKLSPFSGAVIGIIGAKIYQKRHIKHR